MGTVLHVEGATRKVSELIYLDNHATTPCDPRVVEAMLPYFTEHFGNPASSMHIVGRHAEAAVEIAREQVAVLIGARRGEIVFTSGATESNNLAISGIAQALREQGICGRVITTAIEHKSVLLTCRALEKLGFDVVVLPVDSSGRVETSLFREVLATPTVLVSVQAANNEIGTIQDIKGLAALAHEHGAVVHCDAAQAVGKIPVDVEDWDVDLLSLSAHKLYGPKGVGALFVQGSARHIPLNPLVFGGGQEQGMRSGTLNVPGIVGLGEACRICQDEMSAEFARVKALRDLLEALVTRAIPSVLRNGDLANRLPNNSSLTFPNLDAEALIANLPGLALSTGSACTTGAPEPSHVLQAIGLSREESYGTLRVGLGRFTAVEELQVAATIIETAAKCMYTQAPRPVC